MSLTPKLADALRHLSRANNGRIGRAHRGFGFTGITNSPLITRRTANALVCAGLADYNDRFLPSAITLTEKGQIVALTLPPEPIATGVVADVDRTPTAAPCASFGMPARVAA